LAAETKPLQTKIVRMIEITLLFDPVFSRSLKDWDSYALLYIKKEETSSKARHSANFT